MAPRARSKRKRKQSRGNGNSASSPSVRSIRREAWGEFFEEVYPFMDEMEARMKKSKLAKSTWSNQAGGMADAMGLFLLFCFTVIYWLINYGRGRPGALRQIFEVFFASQN